jgi:putative flippase GtrA
VRSNLRFDWIEQGFKFLIVGAMNTAVDLGLYYLLTRLIISSGELFVAAKAISYSAGVLNSYLWNRSWTFQVKENSWKDFLPFVLINLVGLGFNAVILWFGLRMAIPEFFALLLATCAVFLWNFTVSKFMIFKR